jgi:hypothetical protein
MNNGALKIRRGLDGAILLFLMGQYVMKKPPEATSRILALTVELDALGLPFFSRQEAADICGCAIDTIDATLSVSLDRQLLSLRMDTRPSEATPGRSVKLKFYVPCPELQALVKGQWYQKTLR